MLVGIALLHGPHLVGQTTERDTVSLPLPVARPLRNPPLVDIVGRVAAMDGTTHDVPLLASLAVTDLDLYDLQLRSIFPRSADHVADDSIRAAKVARAQVWMTRLRSAPRSSVEGRQAVSFADVALRAGQDTAAERILNGALKVIPSGKAGAVARSFVLASAIALLTRADPDPRRLAKNIARADRYVTALAAIPTTGYATRSDSTAVLYRQYLSALVLTNAADLALLPERVVHYAEQLASILPSINWTERREIVIDRFPYRVLATALMNGPGGRSHIETWQAKLLTLVAPRPGEVIVGWEPMNQVAATKSAQETLHDQFASFDLLGRHAPSIAAHAWINTPDSAYAPAPRTHAFDDGVVRVLAIANNDDDVLPVLDRLQRQFASGVQVVLATSTDGHVGPDILTPADEVAWWSRYYHQKRHFTFPVALWAGSRVPQSYGTSRPEGSTAEVDYHAGWIHGMCILVDGRGVVRAYEPVATRTEEEQLARRVRALLGERETEQHKEQGE